MLVSHQYKFIFIKTRKTASTSVELALSPFMNSDDIVTASSREQERQKKKLGLQGATNFTKPYSAFTLWDWKEWVKSCFRDATGGYRALHASFYSCWPHMPASAVREHVGVDVWNSYYKFAVERDPWDKVLSLYFFSKWRNARGLRPGTVENIDDELRQEFIDWLKYKQRHPNQISDTFIYCEDDGSGEFMLDHLIPYSQLQDGLAETAARLKLPDTPDVGREKFNAHGGIRKKGFGMELFTPEAQELVAQIFAREFEILGIEPKL